MKLANGRGERLDHVLTPGREGSDALVVLAHGVTSSHDRPYLVDLCAGLARAGLASLRFSFAGNGDSAGRFEECTISKEVDDLGRVLDAFEGRAVAFVGHSMGAAVGVLRAARDARIRALVSLAGMVRVQRFVQRHFGRLAPGDPLLGRARCPLSQAFLDDARAIGDTLHAGARLRVPHLLVHGTADDLVPLSDSLELLAASTTGCAELVRLEGADHRFSGRHDELIRVVVPWLKTALRAGEGRS